MKYSIEELRKTCKCGHDGTCHVDLVESMEIQKPVFNHCRITGCKCRKFDCVK